MMTLRELIPMLDSIVEDILIHRMMSKDKFIKTFGSDSEDIYDAIQKAKPGFIKIEHFTTGAIHHGFTAAFGEGIGCYMSNENEWFTTSVIQYIDWDNKVFKTQNSVYKFEFEEIDEDLLESLCTSLRLGYQQTIEFYEGKNKETE